MNQINCGQFKYFVEKYAGTNQVLISQLLLLFGVHGSLIIQFLGVGTYLNKCGVKMNCFLDN